MKIIRPFKVSDASLVSCNVSERDYDRWSSTATYNIGNNVVLANPSSDVTITTANPAVVSWPYHNLSVNDAVVFRTTGGLPTGTNGITANKPYYIKDVVYNTVVASIAMDSGLFSGVYCSSTNKVYVSNSSSAVINIIDPTNNTLSGTTISITGAGSGLVECAPYNALYASSGNNVKVIDLATNTVTDTISLGYTTVGLLYVRLTDRIYAVNSTNNSVTVINPSTKTVVTTISVGTTPNGGICYCEKNNRIYVPNSASNNISVINPDTNTVEKTISAAGAPNGAIYCPDSERVYVGNYSLDKIWVIDPMTTTNADDTHIINSISVGDGPRSFVYSNKIKKLFVVNYLDATISVVDVFKKTVVSTISVGSHPWSICISDSTDTLFVPTAIGFVTTVFDISGKFTISSTEGGTELSTASGSQSGTHSAQALLSPVSAKVSISKTSPAIIGWSGHGFYDDDEVTLYSTGALPTGFTANKVYYIKRAADATFQLTETPGGASVNATSDGTGVFFCAARHHKVYECVADSTSTPPVTNLNFAPHKYPDYWLDTGSDNRWKMFDDSVSSQTLNADTITCNIKTTGRVDSLALLNTSATSATITATDTTVGVVYGPTTVALNDNSGVGDWWSYFFEPITYKSDYVNFGFPPYSNLLITVTVTNTGKDAGIGAMVLGLSKDFGSTQYGASVGILDYSVKQRDTFGNYSVLERAFSKRAKFTIWVDGSMVDSVEKILATYRATPAVYVGTSDYQSTFVYGFYKDFNIDISYPSMSVCSIDVEGLT